MSVKIFKNASERQGEMGLNDLRIRKPDTNAESIKNLIFSI